MNGIKSITEYSQYIIGHVMNKQMNEKDSMLFQSIREYYHQELIPFFEQCKIKDRGNLYRLASENLAQLGWKDGLETIRNKILTNIYKNLLEKIHEYLRRQEETFRRQGNSCFQIVIFCIYANLEVFVEKLKIGQALEKRHLLDRKKGNMFHLFNRKRNKLQIQFLRIKNPFLFEISQECRK